MTAPVILAEATPWRAVDGIAETVRLAGGGADKPYRYLGQDWKAGIVALPTWIASLAFEGGEIGLGGVPAATQIDWAPASSASLAALAAYYWTDAAITVRIGPEGADPPIELTGKVLEATTDGGVLKLALADPAATLKKPFPVGRFLGTGGVEGPVEWTGLMRRRLFGRLWNLRGDPIDKANNLYCFGDPQLPIQSIDAVRDKGAAAASLTTLAWQGSVAATFTALQAASAPQGGGVRCPSIACVKWWTQPAGDLTADLKGEVGAGYVETTAEIAAKLVSVAAGPGFASGTVAAAASARPAPVGWLVSDDSTTTAAMLDALLGASSLLWLLNAAGEIAIREWAWGASAASANSLDVSRKRAFRPLAARKLGYQRNELPMARGDLAAIVLWQSDVGGAGKPSDNAGSNFSLVAGGETAKVTIAGNNLTQTVSTVTSWNAWAYTEQSLVGTAIVSGKHDLGTAGDGPCFGLVTPANKNLTNYTSMAYAIHRSGATFYALENVAGGSSVFTLSGTAANGDILSVVWDNVNVKYYQGTTLLYTSTQPPAAGSVFHAKCMFNAIGSVSSISNLLFTPYTDNNFASIGGATKPENNADVTINAQVVVDNTRAVKLNANQYGTVIVTGQLPKVLTPTVTKGGVDKRTDNLTGYAILNTAGGCVGNVTVNNTGGSADKGRQTIGTGITASGYYDLQVTYNSVVQPLIRVTVTKENALPPSGGGGSGGATKSGTFDPTGLSIASTSYVEMARISGLVKASGETIRAYLDITYYLSASATALSTTVTGQWQYSVAGANSWTAFSSPASSYTGSGSTWNNTLQEGDPGALTCNQTAAPADGTYDIRLVLLESSTASSRVQSITAGTASVVIAV